MKHIVRTTILIIALVAPAFAQNTSSADLAELNSLKDKVKDADTRTRVSAFHRVWTIALASNDTDVKLLALELMQEPVGSASDHIRMPAVYAIAEVANSTADGAVKAKALASLQPAMAAAQLPIRLAVIDAINSMMRSANSGDLALQAVQLVGEAVRSGNNGVRIPAINSVTHIALASNDDRVIAAAVDLMQDPLNSEAMIGGMEVRMMAVVEVEKLGLATANPAIKAKASQMLQSYASNSSWEPEAQHRASEGAGRIQGTMKEASPAKSAATYGKLSVSSTPGGADIEIDGSFVGNTPSEISVAEGNHAIVIKKAGFVPWERKLKITAGSAVHIDAELAKASTQ